jgi:uncharacterized protein YlaI
MSEIKITKKCSVCGQEKNLDEFRKQSKNKDGLKYYCKECDDEWNRKNYQTKKDKILEGVKKWQSENPEKVRLYKRRYKAKKLGKTTI